MDKFSHSIRSAFSGPDGGLTNVRINDIVKPQFVSHGALFLEKIDFGFHCDMGGIDETYRIFDFSYFLIFIKQKLSNSTFFL